jgi:hypothetical protein
MVRGGNNDCVLPDPADPDLDPDPDPEFPIPIPPPFAVAKLVKPLFSHQLGPLPRTAPARI